MEIEAKYAISDPAVFDALLELRALGEYGLRPTGERHVVDHYLETAEREEDEMAKKSEAEGVYKIVEVVGVSEVSWEDAGRQAVKTAEAWGEYSNMVSGFPVMVNGTRILTSEALYQCCRFPHLPRCPSA